MPVMRRSIEWIVGWLLGVAVLAGSVLGHRTACARSLSALCYGDLVSRRLGFLCCIPNVMELRHGPRVPTRPPDAEHVGVGFHGLSNVRHSFIASFARLPCVVAADPGVGLRGIGIARMLLLDLGMGQAGPPLGVHCCPFYRRSLLALIGRVVPRSVTLKKLECSKQAYALDTLAWDNIIGFRSYSVGPGSE
ncbi:hypothetical protein FNV43_RR20623 [Rhamnella rubrinervis]|uniref:Uncharacterized protein n=1 Tax=Rhamnella rubrinervis TaxID=2594499 RepID=A0A8K0DUR5_9ROSA|nr:hypothetical protein FNV43_RR20623 [Rhamnella rubrinervis]